MSFVGQEIYDKVQTTRLCGGNFTCYPTSEDILDNFDMSMLDWECSRPPVNDGGCSPLMGHCHAVNSSYAGYSGPSTASRDWRSYENDSLTAVDTRPESQVGDSDSTFPPQVTTAAEGWSAAVPDQSRFPWENDSGHSLTGRKLKMYELPPQSDPKLEKKRMQAINALRNRLRGSQLEEEKYTKLDAITRDVSRLKEEKSTRQQTVATLQAYLSQLSLSSSSQHTGSSW